MRIGSAGRAPLPLLLLTFVCAGFACAGLGAGTFAASARAEGCPNEQLRGQDGYALALPDCRAYEQVSPVDKNFTDALGESDVVQSSPSGDRVTFFSDAPFPGVLSATGSSTLPQHPRRWRMVDPGARAADHPPLAARGTGPRPS